MVLALVLWAPSAWAIGNEGEAIDTSDYTIDLHQGPVTGGSRVVGLAGAYEAIAEGILATQYNPAAVALRVPWSQSWFDWEVDGGITFPASLSNFDYDNNGDGRFTNSAALFVTGGLGFQLGPGGIGLTADYQLYQLDSRSGEDVGVDVSVLRVLLVGGYAFLDGEIVTGIGIGLNAIDLDQSGELFSGEDRSIASVRGPTFHAGIVWAPAYASLRIGLSGRGSLPPSALPDARPDCAPPTCELVGDDYISQGFYLPRTITLPNEIRAGIAYQFFRPLNVRWIDPDDDRYFTEQAERAIARQRRKRGFARRDAMLAAQRRGEDISAVDRKYDAIDEAAEEAEEDQLDEAEEADEQRRLMVYKELPRPKLLLTAGAKVTLQTANGVGLESFLDQVVERSGESITVQPHGAVETEVWPGYITLRGGSYLEPTRFRDGSPRWHGTGGLDVRIPIEWSIFGLLDDDTTFRVSGAIDGAPRYFGWGAGVGLWH
jgi:hypothetical protein